MTYALTTMPTRAERTSNGFVRGLLRRAKRWASMAAGFVVMAAGVLIAPLPGPMGLPVVVVGLVIVLRNSFWAKKQFVRFQRAHPRLVFPIRRLLRREPEILPVLWQQMMRFEKLIVPRRWRFLSRTRRTFFRRR